MRRTVALLVTFSLVWWMMVPAAHAQTATAVGPPGLIQVEQILYGQAQEGPLVPRLEKAERDVYGRTQDGSAFLVRLQRLQNMLTGAEGDIPLKMKLNAIEWVTFRSINENPSIQRRLELLESQLYGQIFNDMSLVERLDQLLQLMWPGGRIYAADATIPKGTLIRIELLTELNSEKSQLNDVVRYRVLDDVTIEGKIAIPAGSEGQGRITAVTGAGRLGQDGRVQVDFGSVLAMDSTPVPIHLDERATERNKSLELAAGASIAGIILLGPIGLTAGYFVQGREHVVPQGSVFYVEVARDTQVRALSLVPTGR